MKTIHEIEYFDFPSSNKEKKEEIPWGDFVFLGIVALLTGYIFIRIVITF